MNQEKQKEIADFRYSLIAELANPHLPNGAITKLIKEKAKREYLIPYSKKNRLSAACIKKWLISFKKYGKNSLLPKNRNDLGRSRSITVEDEQIIISYLEQNKEISGASAVRYLSNQGRINGNISSSSLSRFLTANGYDRQSRISSSSGIEEKLKFNFEYPLECVQADCMHGIAAPDGKGKKRTAILIAFIDDATRRILYSTFTFTEKSIVFEQGIKHILKTHGKIGKLYVDNGSTFVSNQTRRILDILEIILVHSRPGKPAGRGKIERYFRTVQDQFVRTIEPDSILSLDDLNVRFKTWLETEYHRNPHRGLNNNTPLETWLSKTQYIIKIRAGIDLDKVFLHEVTRKVYKDSTITIDGILYEVNSGLIGKTVRVYYDPVNQRASVTVYCDGISYGEACTVDSYANTRVKRNFNTKEYENIQNDLTKQDNIQKTNAVLTGLKAAKITLEANHE